MLKAIILDFDGIVFESVEIKTEGFRKLFSDYPEHVDKVVAYHRANGGMSRYEKFKVIYRDFLKLPLTVQKSQELGDQFAENCLTGVLNATFVPGAEEFLKQYYQQFLLFIASGTPEDEMRFIVKERKLGVYFKGVFGSPKTKTRIINDILSQYGLTPSDTIFVGDSINDFKAAQETGLRFIGRFSEPAWKSLVKEQDAINDLRDLSLVIQRDYARNY